LGLPWQTRRGSSFIWGVWHADSQLLPGSLQAIEKQLSTQFVIGGNFKLTFDGGDEFSLWLNDFYAGLRRRGFYYGDSGIFIRRSALNHIGGLKDTALMEDFDLVRRMEKYGETCSIDEPGLITSSRRFYGRRKWQIIFGWIKIHLFYYLGLGGEMMARQYDSVRARQHSQN